MKLAIIQLNMFHGKYLDALIPFLSEERPDILTLQEVGGGVENTSSIRGDLFSILKERLGMQGVVVPNLHYVGDPVSYSGNAVLTSGIVLSSSVIWLCPYKEFTSEERWDITRFPSMPRSLLDTTIRIGRCTLHAISVHGAWNKDPVDTPENMRQASLIASYLRGLGDAPFLLGGDLNMPPDSRVIQTIDAVARNAVIGSSITRTLHPELHYLAKVKPAGLLVDYIYTSPHFTVEKIDAPVVPVSDHLPVRALLRYGK